MNKFSLLLVRKDMDVDEQHYPNLGAIAVMIVW
jgi:hypothetical protein